MEFLLLAPAAGLIIGAVIGAVLAVGVYMWRTRCKRLGHNWCAYGLDTDKCLRCGEERDSPGATWAQGAAAELARHMHQRHFVSGGRRPGIATARREQFKVEESLRQQNSHADQLVLGSLASLAVLLAASQPTTLYGSTGEEERAKDCPLPSPDPVYDATPSSSEPPAPSIEKGDYSPSSSDGVSFSSGSDSSGFSSGSDSNSF